MKDTDYINFSKRGDSTFHIGHDTEDGLLSLAALVNTLAPEDTLAEIAQLDDFVTGWGYTGAHERSEAELKKVRALRPRFLEAWSIVATTSSSSSAR